MSISPGEAFPLGATWDGAGTNFSVYAGEAEAVELCVFDERGAEERHRLTEVDAHCWHGYLDGAEPGTRYGYRVHGAYEPDAGRRANPAKLLLDPYAKAVEGEVRWGQAVFGYRLGGDDLDPDHTDSAPAVPKALVVDPAFDWGDDRPPRTGWADTVVYETHVRGLTRRHPEVPAHEQGTFAGVAHPALLEHFRRLGVTAVELLPVHQFVHDQHLSALGLRNYWGYSPIAYLAPHNGYASRPGHRVVDEFKAMVKALHAAGVEVILDVVYNHTAEGGPLGPTLSLRGLDNRSYYHLVDGDLRRYRDTTGTGNSLNVANPYALQLVMDSLRYWVTEMHVDGFRFDLAPTLARPSGPVDRLAPFFDLVHQDPVVGRVKLVAEPWDLGPDGYQVGNFPPRWSEWNGRYRDAVRDYWRQSGAPLGELGRRLSGSADLYAPSGRPPTASVNLVTCHDGFTLLDLVSYDAKHNDANGEDGRDGTDDNRSWNCGVEGPTAAPDVLALRRRQVRNLLATLFLSQGVPMLLGGDELGRTQGGNNNAYCQDNETSWYDWQGADVDLLAWTAALVALRRRHPALRRRQFLGGRPRAAGPAGRAPLPDIAWFRPDGALMADADWDVPHAKSLAMRLDGAAPAGPAPSGRRAVDGSLYLLVNAWEQPLEFTLPGPRWGPAWTEVLDTACPRPPSTPGRTYRARQSVPLLGHHLVVLARPGG